ncbi:MAG: hypothetical protein II273_06890 [Lachnospiraceae bacterium]|nr:hypothetical protein [Lachnospiraceae bacterium]
MGKSARESASWAESALQMSSKHGNTSTVPHNIISKADILLMIYQNGWHRGLNYSSREFQLWNSRDFCFNFNEDKPPNGGMIKMYRTHRCNEIRESHIGQRVELAGWVDVIRDHGGVLFVDLRDETGITQVVVHDENLVKGISKETVISVSGVVTKRDESTVNPKIETGLVELVCDKLDVLGVCSRDLPFEIGSKETGENIRLNH